MPPLLAQSTHLITSLAQLERFAQGLAQALRPGDLVALDGALGAGKTTLAQHLGQAIGVRETIASPTFVLMNEYLSGPYPVAHVDLYRLGPDRAEGFAGELYGILDEGRALVLVEWACYGEFLQDDITVALQIDFASLPASGQSGARIITVSANRLINTLPLETEASSGQSQTELSQEQPESTS